MNGGNDILKYETQVASYSNGWSDCIDLMDILCSKAISHQRSDRPTPFIVLI